MKKLFVSTLVSLACCVAPIVPSFASKSPKPQPKKECTPPPPDSTAPNGIKFKTVSQGPLGLGDSLCVLVLATNIPGEPNAACVVVGCRDGCIAEWSIMEDSAVCTSLQPLQGTVKL